jgi:hypothetical protein
MAQQLSFVKIQSVTCLATEDLTGSDDLVGVMGPARFAIGTFNDGDIRRVDIQQIVPRGVTTLDIFEGDAIDADDLLGTIDLTQDTDVDRVFSIVEGRARYVINFGVATES